MLMKELDCEVVDNNLQTRTAIANRVASWLASPSTEPRNNRPLSQSPQDINTWIEENRKRSGPNWCPW